MSKAITAAAVETERGLFPVDRLIETFALDRIKEAAARADAGEVIKPVPTLS
jgi:Zn-dependent alcohol dehydrogenase